MKYCACVTYINCGKVEQHGCISAEVGDFPCNPLTNIWFVMSFLDGTIYKYHYSSQINV